MKRQIIKWCLTGLWTVVLFALQSALGERIMLFGIKPNLMPFVVCGLAAWEGAKKGAWYGFFAGLFCDAFFAGAGFFSVLYFLCGYGTGILCERYFSANYVTASLFGAVASVLVNFCQYVIFYMIFERVTVSDMLYIVGVEAAYSLALSVIAYVPLRLCARVTQDRRREYRRIKNRY